MHPSISNLVTKTQYICIRIKMIFKFYYFSIMETIRIKRVDEGRWFGWGMRLHSISPTFGWYWLLWKDGTDWRRKSRRHTDGYRISSSSKNEWMDDAVWQNERRKRINNIHNVRVEEVGGLRDGMGWVIAFPCFLGLPSQSLRGFHNNRVVAPNQLGDLGLVMAGSGSYLYWCCCDWIVSQHNR